MRSRRHLFSSRVRTLLAVTIRGRSHGHWQPVTMRLRGTMSATLQRLQSRSHVGSKVSLPQHCFITNRQDCRLCYCYSTDGSGRNGEDAVSQVRLG